MTSLTQARREYLQKRPGDKISYECVQFSHSSFGDVYLVANQFFSKIFTINGLPYDHLPVSMKLPPTTDQVSDPTRAGTIQFGRVGMDFRQKIRQVMSSGKLEPIMVTLRVFEENTLTYERTLQVANNGISLDEKNVNVRLTVPNYAKVTRKDRIYDPETFVGLQNG